MRTTYTHAWSCTNRYMRVRAYLYGQRTSLSGVDVWGIRNVYGAHHLVSLPLLILGLAVQCLCPLSPELLQRALFLLTLCVSDFVLVYLCLNTYTCMKGMHICREHVLWTVNCTSTLCSALCGGCHSYGCYFGHFCLLPDKVSQCTSYAFDNRWDRGHVAFVSSWHWSSQSSWFKNLG